MTRPIRAQARSETREFPLRALLTASALTAAAAIGVAALTSGALAQEPTGEPPVVGEPAPAFTGMTASGEEISLSDFEGETVVLEWTNHGCPYVARHYEGNMQAQQDAAMADGAVWIQIISSVPETQGHVSAEEALALNEERGSTPSHTILDETSEIGRAYHAMTTPHMYVIDEDGVLRYAGGIDDQPRPREGDPEPTNYVALALEQLAAGEEIAMPQTQPYGCNVKYSKDA